MTRLGQHVCVHRFKTSRQKVRARANDLSGMHCQKNNVHCEGYPPKDYWQSGRQRALKGKLCIHGNPLCSF